MDTPLLSGTGSKRRALVLISGKSNNYFYNLCGRRLAETLRELSFEVDVTTLAEHPSKTYDWCVLSNISEVMLPLGDMVRAFEKLRKLKQSCKVMTSAAMECAATHWFRPLQEYTQEMEIESFLDIGLHDQREYLPADARSTYHFLMNGLTTSETASLDDESQLDKHRPIPWAFVGHQTPERVAVVDYLIQHVDPRGFVYIPHHHSAILEKGSPHMNQEQFDQVLHHTRYQIWCSHHEAFYLESERFRMSLLAGSVPVKVVADSRHIRPDLPFSYLTIEAADLAERLRSFDFKTVRQRFRHDFRQLAPLRVGLAEFLVAVSVIEENELFALRRRRAAV